MTFVLYLRGFQVIDPVRKTRKVYVYDDVAQKVAVGFYNEQQEFLRRKHNTDTCVKKKMIIFNHFFFNMCSRKSDLFPIVKKTFKYPYSFCFSFLILSRKKITLKICDIHLRQIRILQTLNIDSIKISCNGNILYNARNKIFILTSMNSYCR